MSALQIIALATAWWLIEFAAFGVWMYVGVRAGAKLLAPAGRASLPAPDGQVTPSPVTPGRVTLGRGEQV